MEIFVSVSVIIAAVIVFLWIFPSANSPFLSLWKSLPTKEQYLQEHPIEMNAEGSPQCFHCHSDKLLDTGLNHFTDYRRMTICTECKSRLWREQL